MHVKAPSGSFHVRHRGAVFLDDSLPQKVLLSLLPPRSNNNNHNKKSNQVMSPDIRLCEV